MTFFWGGGGGSDIVTDRLPSEKFLNPAVHVDNAPW